MPGGGQLTWDIPLFDAKREYAANAEELDDAVLRVLSSGRYILGTEVEAFERAAADYLGVHHAVGVASGTDALTLALRALGIGPGDLVLTTPFTFFGTVSSILELGACPVFADIDPATYNLDPTAAQAVLSAASRPHCRLGIDSRRIRALMPVHLYGQAADMEPLLQLSSHYRLSLVEDACQAFGADYRQRKVGGWGDVGCFSFFPTKNLGGFGDGGLVATNNDRLADRVRRLRVHGATTRYHHMEFGKNSRLDALQAALLRVRLRYLDDALTARRRHAEAYDTRLRAVSGLRVPARAPFSSHTFHLYVVRVERGREQLRSSLAAAGIETGVHYPMPLHLQPALRFLGYKEGDFPVAEEAARSVLSIPMFPTLRETEIDRIVSCISSILGQVVMR